MDKARTGFALMAQERLRKVTSKGGKAAHAKGTAHKWTSEEAQRAGRIGGKVSSGIAGRAAYMRKHAS